MLAIVNTSLEDITVVVDQVIACIPPDVLAEPATGAEAPPALPTEPAPVAPAEKFTRTKGGKLH